MRAITKLFGRPPEFKGRRRTGPALKSATASLAVLGLCGCVGMNSVAKRTSGAPETLWTPPAKAEKPPVGLLAPQIPPGLQASRQRWSLVNLVDIGLSNNPLTRAAWDNARSAAAALGAAEGAYLPLIDVTVNASKMQGAFAGGRFIVNQTTLNPEATLSLLVFDFGAREFTIQAARRALEAANWAHNSVIQNVILQIESAYYQYLAARALLKAQEANQKSARVNYEAATDRHEAGVATIADVLQAKTAVSSVELEIVTTEGLIHTLHGQLADAMGLAASTEFEVADQLPDEVPAQAVGEQVDLCIRDAESRRPDLAAARALVLAAQANVRKARAGFFPTITAGANYGKIYYRNQALSNTTYSFGLTLDLPIFTGLLREYQYVQAKLAAESAKDQLIEVERQVDLDVWTSYYGVKTAEQRLRTANDLLASAAASYDVALGRYKEGVGSILDLLAAETQLESGRVQVIQAKADWFLALIQFTHDTGTLAPPASGPKPGATPTTEKGDPLP
jgi:outer membrane protein